MFKRIKRKSCTPNNFWSAFCVICAYFVYQTQNSRLCVMKQCILKYFQNLLSVNKVGVMSRQLSLSQSDDFDSSKWTATSCFNNNRKMTNVFTGTFVKMRCIALLHGCLHVNCHMFLLTKVLFINDKLNKHLTVLRAIQ